VSSFFFKDNNTGQNKPTVALCNVLSELFRHSRHLVDKIEDDLERIDKDRLRSSVKALWSILEKSSHNIAPGSITVVLDAMGEGDPRQGQELLRILDQYFNQADHQIKLLLTTRPLESVLDIFSGKPIINLDEDRQCADSLEKDIVAVINERFSQFARAKHIDDEGIKKVLLE
jgi:hypothetical protein